MPVSVVCDAASVNAAIRESIANSSSTTCSGLSDDAQSLQSNLVASTKRVLLSALEYEEVNKFSPLNVFDTTVKSKCIPLKPLGSGKLNQSSNGDKDAHQNSSSALNASPGQQSHRDVNQLPQPKRILFPRENVQIGWKSSSRKWQVGAGMMNVGNTCYLNSTLQALFHVPAMANWLVSDATHREKCEDESGSQGGCIICAMSKTLIASQSSQSPIRPYLIYSKLKLVCKHLVMGRQEDAHEFLRYLVEAMEKSYLARFRNSKELEQYSKETTPLNQILGGYLKSAVRCLTCGHVSTTYQHFQDLLLDIRKANTIEEALDGYFSRERLEDMGYKCEACKKKVSATKQFSLERAPISLCIQLKRFSMVGTKINKHVAIRPHLDLTPYAASKKSSEQLKYRLVAMVTHLGASQHCGHYTAIGYTDAGGYYQFDDSCVRPISIQNVLNTNAYIIFYELEDSQDYSRQTSTQVSGNHSDQTKANGQIQYNENMQQRQASNTSLSSSNGNASVSINSKLISKLEVSSTSTMIGPQLPERPLLKCTQNSNENGYKGSDAQKASQNGFISSNSFNKLVNSNSSKPYKANNENSNNQMATFTSNSLISPKHKENQPVGSKLLIHFKNNTNSNLFGAGSKFQESNGSKHQTPNSAKVEANIGDCSSPLANQNKSTLPSMPKLESAAGGKDKTPLLHNGLFTSVLSSNSKNPLLNGSSKSEKPSPIKSLVPYESDDESNDSVSVNPFKNESKSENNPSRINHQTNALKRSYKSSDDSPSSSSESEKGSPQSKKKTPPSPPVVKTKTGLWQVTSLDVKSNLNNGNAAPNERKNPFVTTAAIAPSNFYANNSQKANGKDKKSNGNKWNEASNNGESKETVNHMLKFSHRGYGAPVLSWNGHKTDMEKEIVEENRLERKRELRDDEENEMDRGRQKKVKQHATPGRDNPGYNPFQEYQNQQQHQHRRWNGNGHPNGRSFHQNHAYRQNSHRNQNNFRRHRFYQRPHHQRNGDHGFHHRRDS